MQYEYVRARVSEMPQLSGSDDVDEERAAGHVLVAPLDDEHVLAALANSVRDQVAPVAHVLHEHLLCGRRRAERADQQHVRAARAER